MKFCLDARTATGHFPGIGRYVSNLAREMADQLSGGERLIVVRDPAGAGRWKLPATRPGVVSVVESTASPFGLGQQFAIPRLLRGSRTEVYHSPYYLMPYRPGVPTVVTIYDLIPQHFPEYVSARARLLFQAATRLALAAARQVITISEASRRDLLAAYRLPPERVTAIPLAPDPRFRLQPQEEIARVREKYALAAYVLYVGINKPHKNLVRLLEAWQRVESEAVLVIAGAWDERYSQPKRRAAALGLGERVRFLGPVDDGDLPGLYAGARLFVFPSRYEGFGLPVIEAMACGAPVACANTSSLPEVAGEAAVLFDPQDTQGMAEAMQSVLESSDGRSVLQERGLEQAARFSWARTAAETLAVYRMLGDAA